MSSVIVSDLLTTYNRAGKGKTVLILHGWGDNSKNWQSFTVKLTEKYDVIVPDLPGFGGSQAPLSAWGLDDYATFIASFLKKIDAQPAVVIGHSNGGAIALRGLADGIFSADKLVLLASAGIRGESKSRNKTLRLMAKSGKVLTYPLSSSVKQKLRRKVYKTIGSDMLVVEHLQETFKKVITDDVRADAAKLSVPTLLVYGEKDDQAPVRYGQLLHEAITGSTFEVLPGADHFLYRNQEAKVLQLVEDFLR